MSFFSKTEETSVRYGMYVEEFHELFRKHGVSFGTPANFLKLAPKLKQEEQFRTNFTVLIRSVQRREEGRLTLTRMLMIIAIAMAGPLVASLLTTSAVPLVVFLGAVGGWSETEGEPQTVVKSTRVSRVSSAPQKGERLRAKANGDRADEEGEAREHGRLNGGPPGGRGASGTLGAAVTPKFTDPTPVKEILGRLELNVGGLKLRVANIYDRINRIEPQLDELTAWMNSTIDVSPPEHEEIETVDSRISQTSVYEFVGPTTEVSDVADASVAEASSEDDWKFEEASAQAAVVGEGVAAKQILRLRLRLMAVALGSLLVMTPIAGYVLLHRDYGRIAGALPKEVFTRTAPAKAQVAMEGSPSGAAGGVGHAEPRGQPKAVNNVEKAASGPERPVSEVVPVNATPTLGDARKSQRKSDQPVEIPVLETAPAKIHPVKEDTAPAPVILGTEPKMPADMPEAVTGGDTSSVSVARAEAGPILRRDVPEVRSVNVRVIRSPEDLHPSVAVSAGLLSSYLISSPVPLYPKDARRKGLQGDVLVRVLISDRGTIERAVALNGPPSLRGAVEKAMRRWRFRPYVQNGKPVEVQTWVTFHFALGES